MWSSVAAVLAFVGVAAAFMVGEDEEPLALSPRAAALTAFSVTALLAAAALALTGLASWSWTGEAAGWSGVLGGGLASRDRVRRLRRRLRLDGRRGAPLVAAPPLRPRPLRRPRPRRLARAASRRRGDRRARAVRAAAARGRHDRSRGAQAPPRRAGGRRRTHTVTLPRRAEPDRPRARPHPGCPERALERAASGSPRRRARRLLRLRRDRLRGAAPPGTQRP